MKNYFLYKIQLVVKQKKKLNFVYNMIVNTKLTNKDALSSSVIAILFMLVKLTVISKSDLNNR